MVIFDGTLPGTARERWDAEPRFAALPPLELPAEGPVLVFAPHPDDETLGAGGLLTRLEDAGIRTVVVLVTDGEAAERPGAMTREELVRRRSYEFRQAMRTLAPSAELHEFGLPDGGIRELRSDLSRAVLELVNSLRPSLVVGPWSKDGHRDHRIVGEVCEEACTATATRLVEYPIWMWHWSAPDRDDVPWDGLVALPLSDGDVRLKQCAIGQYSSQTVGADDRPPTLHPEFVRQFSRSQEVFMRVDGPIPAGYFESLYARHDDPWSFETRWYEKRKRALTMAALPRENYGSVLELGCSLGLLTRELADRADSVLAVDIAERAVEAARVRLASHPSVTVTQWDIATGLPEGRFDLIVLSEVGYYFDRASLETLIERISRSLTDGGELLACHWRHEVDDYPLTGGQVHEAIERSSGLAPLVLYSDDDLLLGVYSRDRRSVADRAGML